MLLKHKCGPKDRIIYHINFTTQGMNPSLDTGVGIWPINVNY